MVSLALQWDQSMLRPLQAQGLEKALTRAMSKAGGDAIRAMRAESNRAIRARKRMRAGVVSRGLVLRMPRGARHIDDLVWKISVSGAPVPLGAYPSRQVKKGVSVAVNKGKRSILVGAFIATMKSGHQGIFRRKGKGRLPIEELFSTRISDVFNDTGMLPAVFARGNAVFGSSFKRLLPLEIEKAKK